MQQVTGEHLSSQAASDLMSSVPEKIRSALVAYAAEIDYPIEAVVEMALASFLNEDVMSFQDCRSLAAMGMEGSIMNYWHVGSDDFEALA